MSQDVAEFDHIYPMMTPAKGRMIHQAKTSLDEIWDAVIELATPVVSKKWLVNRCVEMAEGDMNMAQQLRKMVTAKWRKLASPELRWRVFLDKNGGKNQERVEVKMVKNHDVVRGLWANEEREEVKKLVSHDF